MQSNTSVGQALNVARGNLVAIKARMANAEALDNAARDKFVAEKLAKAWFHKKPEYWEKSWNWRETYYTREGQGHEISFCSRRILKLESFIKTLNRMASERLFDITLTEDEIRWITEN